MNGITEWRLAPVFTVKLVKEGGVTMETAHGAQIRMPDDAAKIFQTYLPNEPQEHFMVMCLNQKSRVLGISTVYVGSVHTTVVRLIEMFRPAVLANAASVVFCHNHPSGDPTPSPVIWRKMSSSVPCWNQ